MFISSPKSVLLYKYLWKRKMLGAIVHLFLHLIKKFPLSLLTAEPIKPPHQTVEPAHGGFFLPCN